MQVAVVLVSQTNEGRAGSHMLIDEDWISVGVDCDDDGRPRRVFVRLTGQLNALLFETAL